MKINLGRNPSREYRQKFNSLVRKYKGRNVMLTGGGDLKFFCEAIVHEDKDKPPTVKCHNTPEFTTQLRYIKDGKKDVKFCEVIVHDEKGKSPTVKCDNTLGFHDTFDTEFRKDVIRNIKDGNMTKLRLKTRNTDTKVLRGLVLVSAATNNDAALKFLVTEKGCSVDEQDKSTGQTPLMLSIKNNNLKTTKTCIKLGANVYLQDNKGRNMFHYMAINSYIPIVQFVLKALSKKDVSDLLMVQDNEKNTPLAYSLE